ncbi:hypothetical protein [Dactylosporangium sp. CA-139066]|uniref:hypothetical protein n=1 Tax=Dactylosporangium sp. CA-139066 TaxID=3239930 RepID=UPI003D922358
MHTWEQRDADDILAWAEQVTSLPWGEPFPVGLAAQRFGWAADKAFGANHFLRRASVAEPWQVVRATVPDETVTELYLHVDRWTPEPGRRSTEASPAWLRSDCLRRVAALLAERFGPADDVLEDRPLAEGRYWYRGDHTLVVHADGTSVRLLCAAGKVAHAPRETAPVPASWAELGERISAALPGLPSSFFLQINDRDDERVGAYYQAWAGGWEQMTETYGGGRILGMWQWPRDDAAIRLARVTAGLEALGAAGVPGPQRLHYRARVQHLPGVTRLARLGLPWRPPPESLWLEHGTGAPLPVRPSGPDGGVEVLFGQPAFDVAPVAFEDWPEPGPLEETDPAQRIVAVDRITAERVALALTGRPLPY